MDDFNFHHPLLDPVILHELMEYFPSSTWKNYRLVCKTWHSELLKRWRNKMTVTVANLSTEEFNYHELDRKNFMDVKKFMDSYDPNDVHQLERRPFKQVKTFDYGVTIEQCRVQRSFWKLCGPWLTKLSFYQVIVGDVQVLKKILITLTPNLEELEYTNCLLHKEEDAESNISFEYKTPRNVQTKLRSLTVSLALVLKEDAFSFPPFPVSWMNMFSTFTNMKELTLENFALDGAAAQLRFSEVLNSIASVRQANQNNVLNFEKVNISNFYDGNNSTPSGQQLTMDLINQFCDLSLPLTFLAVRTGSVTKEGFTKLIRDHKSTLKDLTLIADFENELPFALPAFNFSVFPQNLTRLEISGPLFDTWGFLTHTPNLVELCVSDMGYDDSMSIPDDMKGDCNTPLEKVKKLSYSTLMPATADLIKLFIKLMPNVEDLVLSVGDEGFGKVCQAWPKLKHWEITSADMSEKTFVEYASLLQNLTSLELNDNDELEKFGRNSIHNGFLKMSKLNKLAATFKPKFRKEDLRILARHVEDTQGVFVMGSGRKCLSEIPLAQYLGSS